MGKRRAMMNVSIPEELIEKLDRIAKEEIMPRSRVVEMLLNKAIATSFTDRKRDD